MSGMPFVVDRLGCRTCFWAGDIFAPKLEVTHQGKRVGIQAFLQSCFLQAFDELAKQVGSIESVIGFEVMCLEYYPRIAS